MKKNVPSPQSTTPPQMCGNVSVSDLMQSENSEIHYKKGKLSIRNCTDEITTTLEIGSYPTGRKTARLSSVPTQGKKADYLDDIRQMLSEGMKQKRHSLRIRHIRSLCHSIKKNYSNRIYYIRAKVEPTGIRKPRKPL